MDNTGNQIISCNVESCKYNKKGELCSLRAIQVAPCSDMHSGIAEEESLCNSYQPKS